jgi:hypothetical protein
LTSSDAESVSVWSDGGCHCGRVRFRIRIRTTKINECNCSICSKKGFLGLIVQANDFELVRGAADLGTYRFNTQVAAHCFCRACGIHPFSRPRSHPDGYDVNVRCLDGWGAEDSQAWTIEPFDGQNWETSVASIRDSQE